MKRVSKPSSVPVVDYKYLVPEKGGCLKQVVCSPPMPSLHRTQEVCAYGSDLSSLSDSLQCIDWQALTRLHWPILKISDRT